jgi:RNA 2',3'-cyclic 3'-phosphodiesterase
MTRIRTFIAVDVGQLICDRLVALQDKLGQAGTEVKWVEQANLHVTLLFLGEVEDRQVAKICGMVAETAATHESFRLSVEGAGCFPTPRRPRILWAGVGTGADALVALHDDLEKPLTTLGYRREERRYKPHVTLGRVRSAAPADGLARALAEQAKWKGGETLVKELHVMSSELTPRGPTYTILSRAPLD